MLAPYVLPPDSPNLRMLRATVTERSRALAGEPAENAPLAVRSTRQTLRTGLAEGFRAATAVEARLQAVLRETEDFREGVRAAAGRRPAVSPAADRRVVAQAVTFTRWGPAQLSSHLRQVGDQPCWRNSEDTFVPLEGTLPGLAHRSCSGGRHGAG